MDIKKLVETSTRFKMLGDPAYYAGSRASSSYINSTILSEIADGIKQSCGIKAHDAFVKMVWAMESMKPTIFLLNLFKLNEENWDLSKVNLLSSNNHIDCEAQGFATTVSAITGSDYPDETNLIRKGFRKAS